MAKLDNRAGQAEELQKNFMRTLIEDVVCALKLREATDTQSNRRNLIRALFAAIEGLVWTYREHIVGIALSSDMLTLKEQHAFSEVSLQVTPQGRIVEQARFVPMLGMIRLTTRLAQRISPNLEASFDNSGWEALDRAVVIRNRLTHPKSISDLEIRDLDLATCQAGFNWLFDLCLTAMEAAAAAHKGYLAELISMHEALKRGDPATIAEYEAVAALLNE